MRIDYVPLLRIQREIQSIPRGQPPDFNGLKRFRQYLRTIVSEDGNGLALPPLVAANPMAKEHVTELLDALLAMDADGIAARAAADAACRLDGAGEFKAALVVVDDVKAGWTNRGACEFEFRFRSVKSGHLPRWSKCAWITGVLWSSEPADDQKVREAILTAIYRTHYVQMHGPARTLGDMLAQEGWALARAGCRGPTLDSEDLAYTREVLKPHLGSCEMSTCLACLFGDAAARDLGMNPQGLSPWAGLALALNEAIDFSQSGSIGAED